MHGLYEPRSGLRCNQPVGDTGVPDIAWFRRDGAPMHDEDWDSDDSSTVTAFLNDHGIAESDALGERIADDDFLLLFNPLLEEVEFTVPEESYGHSWELIVDPADPFLATPGRDYSVKPNGTIRVDGHTALVLRSRY
jgi:isoamylase